MSPSTATIRVEMLLSVAAVLAALVPFSCNRRKFPAGSVRARIAFASVPGASGWAHVLELGVGAGVDRAEAAWAFGSEFPVVCAGATGPAGGVHFGYCFGTFPGVNEAVREIGQGGPHASESAPERLVPEGRCQI